MTDKTPLEDLKDGDLIIIPHPASEAYVLARVVSRTPRGVRINYWSTRTGEWGDEEKSRFIACAYLISPKADFDDVAAKLVRAFTARFEGIQRVKDEHRETVQSIADKAAAA